MTSANSTRSPTEHGTAEERHEAAVPKLARLSAVPAEETTMPVASQSTLVKASARILPRVRAWMLVPPVDAAMLLSPIIWTTGQYRASVALTMIMLLLTSARGRYRARLHLSVLDELPALLGNLLIATALVATVIALRHQAEQVETFLVNVAVAAGLLIVARSITTQLIIFGRRRRVTVHRTVLIGGGPITLELAQILSLQPRYGLEVAGFVSEYSNALADGVIPRLGSLRNLEQVVADVKADVLLITDVEQSERVVLDAVRALAFEDCDLLIVPRMPDLHTQTGLRDHIGSIPIMRISLPRLSGPSRAIKRAFDVAVSGLLLLLLSPLLASCAVAVRIDGGPGVIFRQPRVGRNGQKFDCLKFRSMRPADSRESATNWSIANDNRVTPIGKFLRRTSIDELPQLWNIFNGDMTLVGPRPERPHFVEQFSAQYDLYNHRHRVRAGLTGLAQVSGLRGDTSIADRARYDNYYIENWSLWLDTKIILRTFSEVLFARGR